jgi:hypothetical protein
LIGVVRLEQALKGFFRKCQPESLSEPSGTLVPLLSVNTFEPSATASGLTSSAGSGTTAVDFGLPAARYAF